MIENLFWVVLRTIAIPFVAFLFLRESFLGEEGAVLAIAIALSIVTIISTIWNGLKILGNTLLLKGETVLMLIIKIILQVGVVIFIWGYYLTNFTDYVN